MSIDGINRAFDSDLKSLVEQFSRLAKKTPVKVPCIFISYQRDDENYAKDIADYINKQKIDVYFDLNDKDLKFHNQNDNPKEVVNSISKGLNQSDYMLVIISPDTKNSVWVPFEVGYAFETKGDNMKTLRHKGISKSSLPQYLKVKEMLNGTLSLDIFLQKIKNSFRVYESVEEKTKVFSDYYSNPLSKYLDRE